MNSVISTVPHFSHVKLGFCCFSLPGHLFTLSTLHSPEKLTSMNENLGCLLFRLSEGDLSCLCLPALTQHFLKALVSIRLRLGTLIQCGFLGKASPLLPCPPTELLFVSHLWTAPKDTPSPHKDSPLSSLWHVWRASFYCLTPVYAWEAITDIMVTLR